jgi:predicted hydrocarbon binding protein
MVPGSISTLREAYGRSPLDRSLMAQQLVKPSVSEGGGKLSNPLTGDRVFVLPVAFWTHAVQALEKAYGKPVSVAMEHFAEEYGEMVGRKAAESGLPPEEAVAMLKEIGESSGWGEIELEGDLKKGNGLKVSILNCAFCEKGTPGHAKQCSFIGGLASGVAKSFYSKEYRGFLAEDTLPGEKCTIEVKEVTEREKANWKSGMYFPWLLDDGRGRL